MRASQREGRCTVAADDYEGSFVDSGVYVDDDVAIITSCISSGLAEMMMCGEKEKGKEQRPKMSS